jgi:hypothetical protein
MSQILEMVQTSNSIGLMEMARSPHCRCGLLVHTSKHQQLGFHSIIPRQLEKVHTQRSPGLMVHSKSIERKVMASRCRDILQIVHCTNRDQLMGLGSSRCIGLVGVCSQGMFGLVRSSSSIKLMVRVILHRNILESFHHSSKGGRLVVRK